MAYAATATVKGGFWPTNGVTNLTTDTKVPTHAAAGFTGQGLEKRISRALSRKSLMWVRGTMIALNGIVPGGVVSVPYPKIQASPEMGGKRVIETELLASYTTTANSAAGLNQLFYRFTQDTSFGPTPPANKDGNPLGTR